MSSFDDISIAYDNTIDWESRLKHEMPFIISLIKNIESSRVLDIACGNGNFSRVLSDAGAQVMAFDFSSKMIERAKKRSKGHAIDYIVLDATDDDALLSLGEEKFDASVSNMGLMDMAEITPLLMALQKLLTPKGRFVFSVMHPCFQTPGVKRIYEEEETGKEIIRRNCISISRYIEPETFEGLGIKNQPVATRYFHRPLSVLLNMCFEQGFVLDRIVEPVFKKEEKRLVQALK